jgi:cystathionine gamma-synthase
MTERQPPRRFARRSLGAQAMGSVDPVTRGVVHPIHVATTFERDPDNRYTSGFVYGRPDNATIREAEEVIAMWEGAAGAMLFSSGMAAATSVFMGLPAGSHAVAPTGMYWALRNWLAVDAQGWGLAVDFVDTSDIDAVRRAVKPGRTALVWLETPSNPLWTVSDIAGIAAIAHGAGARLAVDSTVATPVFTRPLELGADIVMHAATKALNGHSDVVAGALATAKIDAAWERIASLRKTFGAILGPFEAFLLIRGMRTLDLRVRAAAGSALALAQRLAAHPHVASVLYPGLPTHPGHDLAARQMQGGFGSMVSVRVKGGEATSIATAAGVALWKRATSLGGVESLIEHRASIEGPSSPCPPDLLRLSVGIEDPEDLFDDLDRALRRAAG